MEEHIRVFLVQHNFLVSLTVGCNHVILAFVFSIMLTFYQVFSFFLFSPECCCLVFNTLYYWVISVLKPVVWIVSIEFFIEREPRSQPEK